MVFGVQCELKKSILEPPHVLVAGEAGKDPNARCKTAKIDVTLTNVDTLVFLVWARELIPTTEANSCGAMPVLIMVAITPRCEKVEDSP